MPVEPDLPVVGGDIGAWGDKLNVAATDISNEINDHESAIDPHGDRSYADTTKLDKSQNLADLEDAPTARAALGLGTAAQSDATDFVSSASIDAVVAAAIAANRLVNL